MSYRHRTHAAYWNDVIVDKRKTREEIEKLMRDFPQDKIKRDHKPLVFQTVEYFSNGKRKEYLREVKGK